MIREANGSSKVSIDYAVENYGIPQERILYANHLCPGLIDKNNQELVNLDRLGLTTILNFDEMPSLGFKVSSRIKENIFGVLRGDGIQNELYDKDKIMAAAYHYYLRKALQLTNNGLGTSNTVSREELHKNFLDYSRNGNFSGIYTKKVIKKEIKSNLQILENIIALYLYFCPLEGREENAKEIIDSVAGGMNKSRKLWGKIWYFAGILPNYRDREDVAGEYFLRLVEGKAKKFAFKVDKSRDISEDDRFMSWSNTLVRNLAISLLRRQKLMDFYLHNCVEREDYRLIRKSRPKVLDNDTSGLVGLVYRQEVKSIVNENIGRMDPKYGEMIKLRFFEGLKYEEIAQKSDIPLGTVQSRLHHALEKFKRLPEIARLGRLMFPK